MFTVCRSAAILLAAAFLFSALAPEAAAQPADYASISIERKSFDGSWHHSANGTLIRIPGTSTAYSQWVLTSRQAVEGVALSSLQVQVGCDKSYPPSQVDAIYVKDPNPANYENDIALLHLVGFPGHFPATVAGVVGSHVGETTVSYGWWTDPPCSNQVDYNCHTLLMEVIDNTVADGVLFPVTGVHMTAENICVKDPAGLTTFGRGSLGTGIYSTSSGSFELIGVMSWGVSNGLGCPLSDYPVVCTRLTDDHVTWITDVITSMATTSCTPCGCPDLKLSSYGGMSHIPNLEFGLQIENMPLPPGFAGLFLQIGFPLTTGVSQWCGQWYLPSAGVPLPPFFSSNPAGTGACGGKVTFPLPIPDSIPGSAVGVVISAQGAVLCADFSRGLTNGWQFTLN